MLNKGIILNFSRLLLPLTRGVCDSRRRLKFRLTIECNRNICTRGLSLILLCFTFFKPGNFCEKCQMKTFCFNSSLAFVSFKNFWISVNRLLEFAWG